MIQSLQDILNSIQQSDLSDAEKAALVKAVKAADKEYELVNFKLDRTEKVKRTTAILLEETIQELELKRKAVESQNHELEIETALERVRAIALSMQDPTDMLEVCRTISDQLRLLGVKEIRNVQTAIIYESKGTYLNFEYYARHDKDMVTEVHYDNHPMSIDFVQQMLQDPNGFYTSSLNRDELLAWYNFQKTTNQFADTYLENADSLNYYWNSAGPVALGISTYQPLSVDEVELFKRFRNVFGLAYRRYLDIEIAQAQAREAQIEAALERVRSKTMAMQKSEELPEVSAELYRQLKGLGEPIQQLTIGIIHEAKGIVEISATVEGNILPQTIRHPIEEPYVMQKIVNSWKDGDKVFILDLKGEEISAYNHFRNQLVGKNLFPVDLTPESHRVITAAMFSKGILALAADEPRPAESVQVLERFAGVFDLTYTRFLDLQKAEAQAREAQVETALERVRSRSMAMQVSEELKEVIRVVFEQLVQLNIHVQHAGFIVDYKENDDMHLWIASSQAAPGEIRIPYFNSEHWNSFNDAKEKGIDFFANHLDFDAKNKFYQTLFQYIPEIPEEDREYFFTCPGLAISTVLLDNIGLYIENFSGLPYSENENAILMRFGKVFQQTYTRFLDLQKAEAQAREAQIEAALERVRSRTMAMHKSDELAEVVGLLYKQFEELDFGLYQVLVSIYDVKNNVIEWWSRGFGDVDLPQRNLIPIIDHPFNNDLLEKWRSGMDYYPHILWGEEKRSWDEYLFTHTDLKYFPQEIKDMMRSFEQVYLSDFFMKHGSLQAAGPSPLPEDKAGILKRFTKVLDLAYTRMTDLQNAEAQAREAKIEAAIEKVRGRAMAMHNSNDLSATASMVFSELRRLGIHPLRSGVALLSKSSPIGTLYANATSGEGDSLSLVGNLDMTVDRQLQIQYNSWLKNENYFPVLRGDELRAYTKGVASRLGIPDASIENLPHEQYGYYLAFSEGLFYAWSDVAFTEPQLNILNRFKTNIDLTFRRYLDLQKAESQARESQIEAALERVRSRTLAMQKSDELAETAAVLFRQLISLGIQPNRLYITIIKDQGSDAEFWITDEDGSRVSTAFHTDMLVNPTFKKMLDGWKSENKTLIIDMQGEELENYFRHLNTLNVPFKDGLKQKRRVQHIAFFSKGFIGMASPDEQPAETMQLLERFASVFNLTFTRFNDLIVAEQHAKQAEEDLQNLISEKKRTEDALHDLRTTQAQLIQAEKMASLGQLTAGIAHEIQNPLNFVNNFSEVNSELIEELQDELAKGNMQLANELASDIKDNEQKIVHHGKRADAIVKSMLQHSRTGSGQKELTDINAMADEYLRLAYHGMRAKDKSFNVDYKLDLDPELPKIMVMPQEIGRVLLNLINNAFQALTAPYPNPAPYPTQGGNKKMPTVIVRTKLVPPLGGRGQFAEISISDNGPGIPESIKDKIFQPFFTTKPAGQGTGLGLSLSYDIIKAHGGELKLISKEGEGTTFIIELPIS